MSLYKVTLSRYITQEVNYVIEASDSEDAVNDAWEQCRQDINSGNVVDESISEVNAGSDPVELIS